MLPQVPSLAIEDPTTLYLANAGQLDPLIVIVRASAGCSLIGSIAVLAHLARNWKRFSGSLHRIIVCWTCAGLLWAAAALMGRAYIDSPLGCSLQGGLIQFGLLASVMWGAVLATNVLLSVVLHFSQSQIVALEPVYHFAAWTVPGVLTAVPVLLPPLKSDMPLFGDAQLWCWIRREYSPLRMYFFYGPIMALFLYCLVIYVLVGVRLWRTTGNQVLQHSSAQSSGVRSRYALKASLYILALLLTWTFAITNRVRSLAMPAAPPSVVLFTLHAIFTPAQGFLNALVYFAPLLYAKATGGGSSDGASSAGARSDVQAAARSSKAASVLHPTAMSKMPHKIQLV
ncbi:hypothetical protein RI367_005363 [Sorochytrium milnesiophthora]